MATPDPDKTRQTIHRQRRGRNLALLAALLALVALFYVVTIVRMGGS